VDLRTVWRPEQRRDVVARLREKRWSTTRIAEAIGVDPETIRRDLSISANAEIENPSRIDRLGGGTYPSSLPAPAQIADRRDVVARLRERRWSTTRIAEAIGVSEWTVREDLSTSRNLEVESRIERACGGTHPSTMPTPSQIADRRDRAQELRDWLCRWSPGCLAEPNLEPWSALVREPSPIQFGWQAAWPET
jgi:DeoR/GlpR family transcriptional regulator of sugar metabolism